MDMSRGSMKQIERTERRERCETLATWTGELIHREQERESYFSIERSTKSTSLLAQVLRFHLVRFRFNAHYRRPFALARKYDERGE